MDAGLHSVPMWMQWERETSKWQMRLARQTSPAVGYCNDSAIMTN
jgi:hypothetical protein